MLTLKMRVSRNLLLARVLSKKIADEYQQGVVRDVVAYACTERYSVPNFFRLQWRTTTVLSCCRSAVPT